MTLGVWILCPTQHCGLSTWGGVCPLNKEESIRCPKTSQMTIRHWQVQGMLWGLSPSERPCPEHRATTADDMVPAQWEQKLNGRQACHPKTISSTYNFSSQFQGQKQRLGSFAFYRSLHVLKSNNLTSLKISNVCCSNMESHVRNLSLRIHSAIYWLVMTLGWLTLNIVIHRLGIVIPTSQENSYEVDLG